MTTRHPVLVLGRHVVREEFAHRRRLDHVVVDADEDEIFCLHDASRSAGDAAKFRVLGDRST